MLTPGALGRNRTHNPLVRSQVLYPVELLAHMEVLVGFEPTIIELQSIALPAWLKNHISISIIHFKSNLFKHFSKKNHFFNILYYFHNINILKR